MRTTLITACALTLAGALSGYYGGVRSNTSPSGSSAHARAAPGSMPGAPANFPGTTQSPQTGAPPAAAPEQNKEIPLVQYVNTLIGTDYTTLNPAAAVGSGLGGGTVPGPSVPFGMMQWSPMTLGAQYDYSIGDGSGFSGGYWYGDSSISSFSVLHLSGTGCWSNGGYLNVMPALNATASTTTGFSHTDETAQAGYYSVRLSNGIKAELTATTRTGFARFTFPTLSAGQAATLSIDPTTINDRSAGDYNGNTTAWITQVDDHTLQGSIAGGGFCWAGHNIPLYVTMTFSKPFAETATFPTNAPFTVSFNTTASDPTVLMKVGISFVSEANSAANLAAENPALTASSQPNWNFDAVHAAASAAWNTRLNSIQVTGGTPADNQKFYSALYRASLHPNVFNDVNGQYPDFYTSNTAPAAPVKTIATGHNIYQNFSGWDIQHSFMQLQAMLDPARTADIVQSLILDAQTCGAFPRWGYYNTETAVTPGDSGSVIVSNAYAFGATGFDTRAALAVMKSSASSGAACANTPVMAYRGQFNVDGFVPVNSGDDNNASDTLEYSMRDFAVSQFAAALGDNTTASAMRLSSGNWQNILNNGTMTPRNTDKSWNASASTTSFLEGNPEQYVWYVRQDLGGLFGQLGTSAAITKRLDRFFTKLNIGTAKPYFYAGNEVTFGVPWVYAWAGAPTHTQSALHNILTQTFSAAPGGMPGNDDLGAMSAWYVWAALGLYPEIPGVGGLVVSSPKFAAVDIRVGQQDGSYRLLHLVAPGAGSAATSAYYVKSLQLNGASWASAWLPFSKVNQGGTLNFTMTGDPTSTTWGMDPSTMPSFPNAARKPTGAAIASAASTRAGT
jgi:predicted alpha-1,2-mannosidase